MTSRQIQSGEQSQAIMPWHQLSKEPSFQVEVARGLSLGRPYALLLAVRLEQGQLHVEVWGQAYASPYREHMPPAVEVDQGQLNVKVCSR